MTTRTMAQRTLEDRYQEVRARIADAAGRAGRTEQDVLLVAVTKEAGADQVRQLVAMGHRDFGENKVQSLVQQAAMVQEHLDRHKSLSRAHSASKGLADAPFAEMPAGVRWHMIGHLQRNKARKAVEMCRLIHTVDSLRLAEEIHTIGFKHDEPVEVLVQVNCSGEPQKYGCAPPAAPHLIEQIDTMAFVRVRGLMTIAPISTPGADARPVFARCRELFDEIRRRGLSEKRFNLLSMGMSQDYEAAIEHGANIVRVGTAIFADSARATA